MRERRLIQRRRRWIAGDPLRAAPVAASGTEVFEQIRKLAEPKRRNAHRAGVRGKKTELLARL